jgi:DNA (cytosine-5)-methyltransferase 1
MTCVGQVEIDPFCNKVLEKHWPNVKRIKDIHDVTGREFGTVRVVCGGYPCQPESVCGKQQSTNDDRWLWPEMFRVVKVIRPDCIIGENVANHENLGLKVVEADLENAGYQVRTFGIPACAIGLQTMERHLWIIAAPISKRFKRGKKGEDILHRIERKFQGNDKGFYNRWDISQTKFCRVAERVSRKLEPNQRERLKGLGNAVPPGLVQLIGEMILDSGLLKEI